MWNSVGRDTSYVIGAVCCSIEPGCDVGARAPVAVSGFVEVMKHKDKTMKTRTHLSVVLLTTALAVLPAIGFEYDEAVQGDIDNHENNGSLPVFHLDVGTNVIHGTATVGVS